MQLVRNQKLDNSVKKLCPIPSNANSEGVFLALANCNDLTRIDVSCDLNHLLKHGTLFIGKAGVEPDWMQVQALQDLPKFKARITDNYDSCSIGISVSPFMPQFFFAPKNTFRGKKLFNRLK